MNPPAPTPRTDAALYPMHGVDIVWPEFARTLERELAAVQAECDLHRNRLASILWSGAIDKQLCGDVQQWAADYTSELTRLRAEVKRLKGWLADPHALHAHCLRTLTDGQIAHLFGERMTEVANRADRAEAALSSPPLLTGKLTHAGTCYIGEEHVDGVFIAIDREQLKALPRLPMYEQIELRVAMKNETKTP